MAKYLNPGNRNFQLMLNSEIYVDKSELIRYTNKILDTSDRFLCVSRPRRFGKSVTANMLAAYYSCGCDSREQFSGLKIAADPSFERHLNKYNVIQLNMIDFWSKANNITEMLSLIDATLLRSLKAAYPDVDYLNDSFLTFVLDDICSDTGIPFVFIIDEWDCLFREIQSDFESQTKYLDYLRDLLKDRSYVALAYMTGILPIKKYGRHSALNMFTEISMTNPQDMAEFTGFTEDEVISICRMRSLDYEMEKIWYDGYNLHGIPIYNPRSVVMSARSGIYDSYWTQTETFHALQTYISMDMDGLREKVVRMLAGERLRIDTATFQNDMVTFSSSDDILTLLIHLGYLTYDFDAEEVWIPNNEIQKEFINSIKDRGWEDVMSAIRASDELMEATLAGNGAKVAEMVETAHEANTSIIKYNDENSLSCVLSLAYYTARKSYVMHRELPTGKGFADLAFLPRRGNPNPALLIELKWDKSAHSAIDQIHERHYPVRIAEYTGDILLVGVSYGKEDKKHVCQIERWKK